jgi:peptide/nickel transport system substrate-binding protein
MRAFAQRPRKGGVFNVQYPAEQRQLNPEHPGFTGPIIGGKIQENLVDLDAGGKPVGVLAELGGPAGRQDHHPAARGVTGMTASRSPRRRRVIAMNMWKKI